MPTWAEFLPERERWDIIKYLLESFMVGRPMPHSMWGDGAVSAEFATLSKDNWLGEGHTISSGNGRDLYGQYCASCHGDDGRGNGPGSLHP